MSIFCKEYTVREFLCKDGELTTNNIIGYLIETSNYQSIDCGISNEYLLSKGYTWMIYKWKIRLFRKPKSFEKIKVKTWASGFRNINAFREFEIYAGNEKILEASSIFLLIDLEKRKASRIPEDIANAYGICENKFFKSIKRVNEPENLDPISRFTYKTLRRDIDFNDHVNNSVYLELIYESLPNEFSDITFKEININYMKEIKLDDEIIIDVYKDNFEFYFFFKSRDESQIYARVSARFESSY